MYRNVIPAIVCRFYEQTSKGFYVARYGLNDWLFDIDIPSEVEKIVSVVLAPAKNQEAAKAKGIRILWPSFVGAST